MSTAPSHLIPQHCGFYEQQDSAEFADETALDEQVEKMLNEDGFAKTDFIIVKHIDYQIDASGYADGIEESDD